MIRLKKKRKNQKIDTFEGDSKIGRKKQKKHATTYRLPNSIPPPPPGPPGPSTPGLAKLTLRNKSSPLLEGVNFGSHSGLLSTTSLSVCRIFGPTFAISGVRGRGEP
jgi:hypothetical protein